MWSFTVAFGMEWFVDLNGIPGTDFGGIMKLGHRDQQVMGIWGALGFQGQRSSARGHFVKIQTMFLSSPMYSFNGVNVRVG